MSTRRTHIREGDRELAKPWIMPDQKDISVVLVEPAQTGDQLFHSGRVELVLDHTVRPNPIASEDEFHGLTRAHGARAEDEIEHTYRCRQVLADPPRCLTAATVQPSLAIRDILLPARLGVP